MTFEPLTPARRRQQNREYLIEAAARVFAERGFFNAGNTADFYSRSGGLTGGRTHEFFLTLL